MTGILADLAGALSRSFELTIMAKATLVLALGLAVATLLGRARASVRHLVLAGTFGVLLALPIGAAFLPAFSIEVSAGGSVAPIAAQASSRAAAFTRAAVEVPRNAGRPTVVLPGWPSLMRVIWAIGAALVLMRLCAGLIRLLRVSRSAIPWLEGRDLVLSVAGPGCLARSVDVLLHESVQAPLTLGLVRPRVLLPVDAPQWSDEALRRALRHEIEHIHRGDWPLQLTARIVCALYWFHPLVWVAWRRLAVEAERACDDAVIRSSEQTEYAEQLVALARRMKVAASPALLGMAVRGDLSTRVAAILDARQARGRAGARAAAAVLSAAALAMLAIAPLRAVAVFPDTRAHVKNLDGDEQRGRASRRDGWLIEAAGKGDLPTTTELVAAGADINAVVDGDGTPLIAAARNGQISVVRFLLERGADPNLAVSGDGNPLIMAAREGHTAIVELLLARGAIVDQVVPGDENALIQASGEGHLDVVVLLAARGADVNAAVWAEGGGDLMGEWRTPLGMARRGGHTAVEKFLVTKGARQ
jgi:beta-lactamase regulating signal transducer with metallopeptidase domain